MSQEEPAAPEGASTAPEEATAGRTLTDAELKRYGEELQKAVGHHGAVTVEGQKLHLYTAGRRNFRACGEAAKRLRHWPAGIVVVTHRVRPKVPETPEQARARLNLEESAVELKARSVGLTTASPEEMELYNRRQGLTTEQVEQFIAVSEVKAGRPYTEAERAGLRSTIRGGVLL